MVAPKCWKLIRIENDTVGDTYNNNRVRTKSTRTENGGSFRTLKNK